MKKRVLSTVLVICMLCALFPASILTASAETFSGSCGEQLAWKLDTETGVLEITGTGEMTDAPWSSYCDSIKSVIIGNGVTGIGVYAFENCTSLTDVTIPDSVTSIGYGAFYCCTSLTSVIIPDSVTNIDRYAFENCTSLTSVVIPDSVTSIGDGAFRVCTSLAGVTIPDSVTSIGESAFSGCTGLISVTISDSVTSIDIYAFKNCTSLTGIWVDENNPNYSSDEKGVLFNKDKTELIQYPGGYAGDYTIPDSVTSIGNSAFFHTSLTNMTIPESVTSIGYFAFGDCAGLQSVCFLGDAPATFFENAFKVWDEEAETLINIPGLTLYYIEGKEGWTSPTWKGYPTATWMPVHEHSYTDTVIAPTCTEQGYTVHTCKCSDSYIDTYIDALGHDYGDWTQTKAPTCTEKGAEKRTCSRCDTFETREIDALGHTEVVDAAVPATCTEAGKTEGKHCAACNTVLVAQKKIPALGHDFGDWTQTKAPTCTEKGAEKRACSRCDTFETREIDALGHKYENGVCVQCGEKDPNEQPNIEFVDVPQKAWYVEAVNYAVQNGLMNGVGNDQFNPEGSMTRAMLVTVLWRYEGEPEAGKNTFSDVPNGQWYTNAVAWAAENGIVGGVGNNRFDPDGEITREQMATILFRYAEKKGIDTSKHGSLNIFSDEKQLSAYAKDAVQWAVAEQIINGSDGKLLPQGSATRAQVATILMRFIENKIK